jgi:HD-GYP domain-containing protein (c-di-GMP phosphodiesterase class II)
MVRVTGGSPNPLNHLAYPPILVAAFLFGWRGGVAAGILAGVVLGPLANVLASAGTVEALNAWSIRAAAFIGVGLVAGLLFDQGRAHADAWREAAITIAVRERDGIVALARGAEAKDGDTGDHIVRVQLITERLALATGASEADAAAMGWSAMLHDVGKLHIPDRILLKPGPLSADESTVMEQHPIYGEQILQHGAGFELARRIARWHHENLDGSGYPDGLSGAQIPLEARIVRVADAFDAMTHTRPYKDAADLEWALEELDRCAGTQFDPELVRLFVRLVRRDGCWIERLAEHRRSSAVQRPIGALRGV